MPSALVPRLRRSTAAACAMLALAGCPANPTGGGAANGGPATGATAGATAAGTGATAGPTPVGRPMPPLSPQFAELQEYYRIAFLPDGYPGRRDEDGTIFPHPIYGNYVLRDYLDQYALRPTPTLRDAIGVVARASLARMAGHEGALVFWYPPDPASGARLYDRHYSGLTQGYYAVQLRRAGDLLSDPGLIASAERVFASLLIPAERGGVYFADARGVSIAEVPQRPNSWILNGWLSALASVAQYAELSGSAAARGLLRRSAETLARVLPRYDEPRLRTSRYGLTGYTYLRLRFDRAPGALGPVTLHVPGEAPVAAPVGRGTRWQPFVFAADLTGGRPTGSSVRINAVLSLAPHPAPNRLTVGVPAGPARRVVLEGQRGRYHPLASGPVKARWEPIAVASVGPDGGTVSFDIPMTFVADVVYPTNFVKRIQGKRVNVYHRIHINRLREIGELTGRAELTRWADRWEGYICDWATMRAYDGLAVRNRAGLVDSPSAVCRTDGIAGLGQHGRSAARRSGR